MATLAQTPPATPAPWAWLQEFLRGELAPYPGRGALVARMVIASTLVMILSMTFRIPYGAYAAIYALTISRESPQATVNAMRTMVIAFLMAAAVVLAGATLFLDDPLLRLLWVVGIFFTMFYALSAISNYTAAMRFGYLVVITVPLWDRHISAESRVEGTLWAVAAITMGTAIASLVELVFAAFQPGDQVARSVDNRLKQVERLLTCYDQDCPLDVTTEKEITRLAMVGTSRLRRILQRSDYLSDYRERMGALVALAGRLIDIAANLQHIHFSLLDDERQRIRSLARRIADIRADLISVKVSRAAPSHNNAENWYSVPLLGELERTVSEIPEVFAGSQSFSAYAPPESGGEPSSRLFVPNALSNPGHFKFGVRGGLAASLCYLTYTSLNSPELSTAVTTCLLTALTTIGASRQKQILRFTGAFVGGALGIGSQVFILPSFDSISGFTLLFVIVTAVAAWIATASTRLSYFGVQVAVAFDLINLSEFKIQTNLAVARDRVLGIMLGLGMMWLVFDRLWSAPAGVAMKKAFVSTLRSLAQFAREPTSVDLKTAIERSYSLRDTINGGFDKVRALADGVLFEFGPNRQEDMALRERIRQWQPQLRILFLTRIALWKYRIQLPGFELPDVVRAAQQQFDEQSATIVSGIADRIEGRRSEARLNLENAFEGLEKTTLACLSEKPKQILAASLRSLLSLSQKYVTLTRTLDDAI
jgi:multidrug resistance protein MdtO